MKKSGKSEPEQQKMSEKAPWLSSNPRPSLVHVMTDKMSLFTDVQARFGDKVARFFYNVLIKTIINKFFKA